MELATYDPYAMYVCMTYFEAMEDPRTCIILQEFHKPSYFLT